MKNIRIFLSENFHLLVVKFSVYLYRHVFVMNESESVYFAHTRRHLFLDLATHVGTH